MPPLRAEDAESRERSDNPENKFLNQNLDNLFLLQ
jgi:hypothetical protein